MSTTSLPVTILLEESGIVGMRSANGSNVSFACSLPYVFRFARLS